MSSQKLTHVRMNNFHCAVRRPAPFVSTSSPNKVFISSLPRIELPFYARHSTHITSALKANERRFVHLAVEVGLDKDVFRNSGPTDVGIVVSTITANSTIESGKLIDHSICLQIDNQQAPVAFCQKGSHETSPSDIPLSIFGISNDKIRGGRRPNRGKAAGGGKGKLTKVFPRDDFEIIPGLQFFYDHPFREADAGVGGRDDAANSPLGPQYGFKLCIQLLLRIKNQWHVSDYFFFSPERIFEYQGNLEITTLKLCPQQNKTNSKIFLDLDIFFKAPWLSVEKHCDSGNELKEQGAAINVTLSVDTNKLVYHFSSSPPPDSENILPLVIKTFFKSTAQCSIQLTEEQLAKLFRHLRPHELVTPILRVQAFVVAAGGPYTTGTEPLSDYSVAEFVLNRHWGLLQRTSSTHSPPHSASRHLSLTASSPIAPVAVPSSSARKRLPSEPVFTDPPFSL